MAKPPPDPGPTETRVRSWMANLLELLEVRAELLSIEARMEMQRVLLMAVFGVLGALCLAFGIMFLAVFVTVALWDTHALLVLGLLTAAFAGGGLALLLLARGKLQAMAGMFGGSREELRRDQQRLRGEAP